MFFRLSIHQNSSSFNQQRATELERLRTTNVVEAPPKFDLFIVDAPSSNCNLFEISGSILKYAYHISFLNAVVSNFGNIKKPLIREMPEASTIYELYRAVEDMTGTSAEGFGIDTPNEPSLKDDHKIFGQCDAFPLCAIPAFAIDDGLVIFIKTLYR